MSPQPNPVATPTAPTTDPNQRRPAPTAQRTDTQHSTAPKYQLLCFPSFLHALKVTGPSGRAWAPCKDPKCDRLHYEGIQNQLSYFRMEKAAATAEETKDPAVRAAFLEKVHKAPKFADLAPPSRSR